ncbi:TPA: hypothetical protein I7721_19950 [Vibrio vulnificus]|nr:hypothetical protein [Vibrio vulnificus]
MSSFADILPDLSGQSGLVFTCHIHRLPENTFRVAEFTLNEALSSLFTLSVSVVSPLSSINFENHLGFATSLTVTRDGEKTSTAQYLLAPDEQSNADKVIRFYIKPHD